MFVYKAVCQTSLECCVWQEIRRLLVKATVQLNFSTLPAPLMALWCRTQWGPRFYHCQINREGCEKQEVIMTASGVSGIADQRCCIVQELFRLLLYGELSTKSSTRRLHLENYIRYLFMACNKFQVLVWTKPNLSLYRNTLLWIALWSQDFPAVQSKFTFLFTVTEEFSL